MKTKMGGTKFPLAFKYAFVYVLIGAAFLFGVELKNQAQVISPGGGRTNSQPSALEAWTFQDNVNWTSDRGYAPVSFTNLNFSYLGDGASLVVNSNVPAWIQYNAIEADGTTNLTVDIGSITFWFAPNWASTNQGGSGPGEWGRLIEVGGYSPDSSYGLWSIYVDDVGQNIYFSAQTNDLSSNLTTYVSAPISWTTNYWHYIALTYSTTNTDLYLDGILATSGPPITVYPGPEVLTNGLFMGSDSNGVLQAQGMFNNVYTYGVPVDSDTIQEWFYREFGYYIMNPWNAQFMANITGIASTPSYGTNFDVITGALTPIGSVTAITSTNVWMTNVTATVTGKTMALKFTVQGGVDGAPYDVFANSVLDFSSSTNRAWTWMGQSYHGNIYTLTNLPNSACFLILGTPQDSDYDGLTDAYERLVSKTNPYLADTTGDGVSDSDKFLSGSNLLIATPGWKMDYDNDGLPDQYESTVNLNPTVAEQPPSLPSYSSNPIQ